MSWHRHTWRVLRTSRFVPAHEVTVYGRRTEVYKKCTVCGKTRRGLIDGWWEAHELPGGD